MNPQSTKAPAQLPGGPAVPAPRTAEPAGGFPDPCVPALLTPQERAARFARLCAEAMRERRGSGEAGIGTLAEKWLHRIVKRYLTDDPAQCETRLPGTRYIPDVRIGQSVYEVQTGAFAPMREKLRYYLEQTDLSVTVVRPVAQNRWVSLIDPRTQEISPRRRSPRHGRAEELLPELYGILPFPGHPRLRFLLLMLEVYDFRLAPPPGRRGGRARFERIPLSLLGELSLHTPSDFARFVPPALPSPFTVRQFSALSRLRGLDAYSAVRVLASLGLLLPAPPVGRAMAFFPAPGTADGRER